MKNTKKEFTSAAKKTKGFKAWFIEREQYSRDYVIEIWSESNFTIGDNGCTAERIHVDGNKVSVANGWNNAVKALQTIKAI